MKKIIITEQQFKNLIEFHNSNNNWIKKLEKHTFDKFNKDDLNEGIYKTYPIDFVVKHFCGYLNFADNYSLFCNSPSQYNGFITEVKSENDLSYIEMVVYDDAEVLTKVNKTMELCGYYKAFCEDYCEGYLQCGYEKRNEETINLTTDKIYHVTERTNVPKIKRNGLVPKSKNKKTFHLERVYFFTKDYGYNGFLNIIKLLYENYNNFGYIVYEVDTNKLKNVSFHYDVNMENGIYTTDNIPPEALTKKYEYKD